MNLATALKKKNRLVGTINRLKEAIGENNSIPEGKITKVDIEKTRQELHAVVNELIFLKTKISLGNAGVTIGPNILVQDSNFFKIIQLAEYKGLLSFYDTLDVKEGVYAERGGFGTAPEQVTYKVSFDETEKEKQQIILRGDIENLQDDIDEYNAICKI